MTKLIPYFAPFLTALILALLLTPLVKKLALRWGFLDVPKEERKIHKVPIARAGGLAIFVSFFITILLFYFLKKPLFNLAPWDSGNAEYRLMGILLGALILVITGLIDDKKSLSPLKKLIFQIIAAMIAISFGVAIEAFNNPFGGQIWLNQLTFSFSLLGHGFNINLIGDFLSLIWIVGLINVINWLDGLDGLADGVCAIAALSIFFIALLPNVAQPIVATIAIVIFGVTLGFLPYNFNPAKIFMGDSGSQFLGFILASISILGGAKVATAFLVLGLPILDGLWVFARRVSARSSPFKADRLHLHHRLLDLGLEQKKVVVIIYLISALLGVIGILSGAYGKMVAIAALVIFMIIFGVLLALIQKRTKNYAKDSN